MSKKITPMDAIHELSAAIAQAKSPDDVYDIILNSVVELFSVEKASIMAFDPNEGVLRVVAARGMDEEIIKKARVRVGEGISGKVFSSHEPILVRDIKADRSMSGHARYRTDSLMSAPVTCFPLKVGEEALGVINVTDRKGGGQFTEDDLLLLATIANQAAAYMHIAHLMEERAAAMKLGEQLEIARQIQYKLLPAEIPNVEGLDVAGRLITAEKVGGDYYDCFLTSVKRPSFVIADVSGHSIGAGLIMAAFRAAIRSQMDSDYTPAVLVQRINSILYEDLYQSEQFISMIFLQYVRSRQLVQYTVAGHLPPIVWRGSDGKFTEEGTGDGLLGLDRRGVFHEKQLVISKGDVVFLYTDGITEAKNSSGESFGKGRLCECIKDAVGCSARQIADVVVETVQAFVDPKPLRDDITALVLKVV